jgi:hypothetical protein
MIIFFITFSLLTFKRGCLSAGVQINVPTGRKQREVSNAR